MVVPIGNPEAVGKAAEILTGSGIAIFPCDTIYGISGIVPHTEDRIRELKGRGETKPFIRLYPSIAAVEKLSGYRLDKRLTGYWPGPLTLIVPDKTGKKIGVRVPGDRFTSLVLKQLKVPIYSTSVNRSNEPPINDISTIIGRFESLVDIIVDGGNFTEKKPSTIIDTTTDPYTLLRQGDLKVDPGLFKQ
jgi:L-threonylcarbamoyladenylate synthase